MFLSEALKCELYKQLLRIWCGMGQCKTIPGVINRNDISSSDSKKYGGARENLYQADQAVNRDTGGTPVRLKKPGFA